MFLRGPGPSSSPRLKHSSGTQYRRRPRPRPRRPRRRRRRRRRRRGVNDTPAALSFFPLFRSVSFSPPLARLLLLTDERFLPARPRGFEGPFLQLKPKESTER